MNKISALALLLALVPLASNAEPIFWADNGHYYEVIDDPAGMGSCTQLSNTGGMTWDQARTAASANYHLGVDGHLVTITEEAENDFLVDNFNLVGRPLWLGGEAVGSGNLNANWQWITGEAWSYTNWAGGEPNSPSENRLALAYFSTAGTWNNAPSNYGGYCNGGYIVEYDTVAPVAIPDIEDRDPDVKSGETINIDVLDNDTLFGQTVTAIEISSVTTDATALVVPCAPTLCVDYTSAPGFGGDDMFTYKIKVGALESEETTVTITVDGTVSVSVPGDEIVVFGGAPGVPLRATGEFVPPGGGGESSVKCCSVRDPRVGAGNTKKDGPTAFKWQHFDIGDAMGTFLGDADCADMPQPNRGELIIDRHFGVHTAPAADLEDPEIYRFGLCVIETDVDWLGPMHVDVSALDAVSYEVDCQRLPKTVDNQPITLGLTTFPPEYTSPRMRSVTIECDPRGAARWSTWYFVPNAQHLTRKESSKTYVGRMSSVLKGMIGAMREEGAVDDWLLDSVKSNILLAEKGFNDGKATEESPKKKGFKGGKATDVSADDALQYLDMATLEVLGELLPDPNVPPPDLNSPYPGSPSFTNPKGELASHLLALRYAVCSELAHPGDVKEECLVEEAINILLPDLPPLPESED